jgi:hypothetical protein
MNYYAASDRLELNVLRALLQCDVAEPADRVRVLAELQRRLDRHIDTSALVAVSTGTSYAELGRALGGLSRQAARKRVLARQAARRPSQTAPATAAGPSARSDPPGRAEDVDSVDRPAVSSS